MSAGITGVRAVGIPVRDQDAAPAFWTGPLGSAVRRDLPLPDGRRRLELSPGGDVGVTLDLTAGPVPRGEIGLRVATGSAAAARAALRGAGVDVDDLLHRPGVPAMVAFRDPFCVTA